MIRSAVPADVPALHAMIRELAEYERAVDQARATQRQLHDALFGPHPAVFALIAEEPPAAPTDPDPTPVGFALWFRNFSTWTGTHGVYLEDLFVRPQARGGGHGRALLAALAQICATHGYERFEWWVLDWNKPSIGFYESLGAEPMDEWTVFRLSGDPLRALAAQSTYDGEDPTGRGDTAGPA